MSRNRVASAADTVCVKGQLRSTAVAVLVASSSAACMGVQQQHQRLTAPAGSASEADRIAAYERLFARGSSITALIAPNGAVVASSPDYLILGDGTRVAYVEDLAPLVSPDSPTGRAIDRYQRGVARSKPWERAWKWSFVAGLAGGVVLPIVIDDGDGTRIGAGVGSMLAGALLGTIFAFVADSRAGDLAGERISAFTTYNQDLGRQLDVCVDGTRIVSCDGQPPDRHGSEDSAGVSSSP